MSDLAYLVAAAIFGLLLLAWYVWRAREWLPAPRARLWFNRAMLLFALTLNAVVLLRLVQRFEMISTLPGWWRARSSALPSLLRRPP